jgi:hypothetical protein
MPSYDSKQFNPPAPVAYVTLRTSETLIQVSDVPMLLDTGADVTLIPQSVLPSLEITLSAENRYELTGFDGSKSLASVVQLDPIFGRKTFRGRLLVIDQPLGILGRNILNATTILFDGPKLNWKEKPPS